MQGLASIDMIILTVYTWVHTLLGVVFCRKAVLHRGAASSKRCLTKLCLKVEAQSDELCVPSTGLAPELTKSEKPAN